MTLNINTNALVDEKTVVGETLPTVYFDRVAIKQMNSKFFKGDNSLIKNQSNNSDYYSTDLNIIIKDIYNGKSSLWFKNPFSQKIKERIKIAVVQTTNEPATNAWSSVTDSSVFLKIRETDNNIENSALMNGTNIQIFSLNDLEGDQHEDSIRDKFLESNQVANGYVYNFNKFVSFPDKQNTTGNPILNLIPKDQNHLTYTAFTYFDNGQSQLSKINQEIVINNGNIVSEASVFTKTDNGEIWTGPVHYHNGDVTVNGNPYFGYMGGAIHGSTANQPLLIRNIVKNSTIHDLYSLNTLENNIQSEKIVEEKKIERQSIENNSIFSNIYLSKEFDGKVDFTFSIDMNSLLKSKSQNSLNLKNQTINKLMDYVKIKSLKIFRTEYLKSTTAKKEFNREASFSPVARLNKINSFRMDKNKQDFVKKIKTGKGYTKEFIKKYSSDQYKQLIIEAENIENELTPNEFFGDGKSKIAARNDIFLNVDNDSNIINITGTDETIKELDGGLYQYEIELEIEDNRKSYFSELRTKINEQIKKLKSITGLVNKQNYDSVIDKFKNSFVREISFNNEITSISGDYWDEIPQIYVEAYQLLSPTSVPSSVINSAANTMRNMLNPFSGNARGYLKIIEMLEKMNDTINFSVFVSRKVFGPKSTTTSFYKSRASKNNYNPLLNNIKLEHTFDNNFVDASSIRNFGNVFFKMANEDLPNDTPGIRTISYDSFVDYKNSEVEKIYSSPNADLSIGSIENARMDLDLTSYTYFTPSLVYNRNEKPDQIDSVLSFNEEYVDMVITGLTSEEEINLNSGIGNIGKNSLEKKINSLNGKLDGYFSAKHNTSVVTSQNNPNVFSAKTNNISPPGNLNDFGGQSKTNKTTKNETVATLSISKNILSSLLTTKLVLKQDQPTVTAFSPEILSTDSDNAGQVVSNLPNQLKSLVIAQDTKKELLFSPNSGIKAEIIEFINQDPFSKPETVNAAKNLFQNIVVVQYLSGYLTNGNNQVSIKEDNWRPLTKEVFNRARGSNRKLFCRLLPYSSPRFNVKYDETLPIIDNYFFISNEEQNVVMQKIGQPELITSGLSNQLDNPQYQMTFYRQEQPVSESPTAPLRLNTQPAQVNRPTLSAPISQNTGGGNFSGGGY